MTDTTVRIHLVTAFVPGGAPGGPRGAELPTRPGVPPRGLDERLLTSSVTTRVHGEVLDVELSGDVDLLLRDELALVAAEAAAHCRAHDRARVVVDVAAVRSVDTTTVRFVDRLRRRTEDAHGTCTVTGARPAVRRALDLLLPPVPTTPTGELLAS